MDNKKIERKFIPLAHISAAPGTESCGYGAVVSLSPAKRKIIHGIVNKSDAQAYAVYAELKAVLEVVRIYIENDIHHASIKLTREKAMNAITKKEAVAGCSGVVNQILGLIDNRDYRFCLEEEKKTNIAYTMAGRAVGVFNYKNNYKWRPDCEKNITDLFRFCVQEFYTRKTHEQYEYLHFAKLMSQYSGPKHDIPLPINVRGWIDCFSNKKENRDIAAMFYLCGLTEKDSCKCASILIRETSDEIDADIRNQIKILALDHDRKSRDYAKLNNEELDLVINLVFDNYYKGLYPKNAGRSRTGYIS